MKVIRVLLVSLMVIAVLIGILGAVSSVFANSGLITIHVKQATLTQQNDCQWGVGSWHFVINQINNESNAPLTIHVIWDNGASADVALSRFTGKVAHYTTSENAGYKVIDATAQIYSTWSGQFNLSDVTCQDSVCPIGPAAYKWSELNPPGYLWDPYPSIFKSWNQVSFTNNGSAMIYNVTATITCTPANVTAPDPTVTVGDIPAGGSAWSTDDFALVTDMTNPQDPGKMFVWKVEYDDADGNHHVIQNVPKYCGEPINCP